MALRIRRDIFKLQQDWEAGSVTELENLIKAFDTIAKRSEDNLESYFTLAGYHGLPHDPWYCTHLQALFPTWHRAYLMKFEDALRSVPGCENVTLPYWDATSQQSLQHGLPHIFTDKKFQYHTGEQIDNPLYSYTMVRGVQRAHKNDPEPAATDSESDPSEAKIKGYHSVRFPYSGWNDTETRRAQSKKYNAWVESNLKPVELLNDNIKAYLNRENAGGLTQFEACIKAPNFTVLSNLRAVSLWNNQSGHPMAESLESPHNAIHNCIGSPNKDNPGSRDRKFDFWARGDMSDVTIAAFDPFFFFHHCNIDRVFWIWQKANRSTTDLGPIDNSYPGTTDDNDVAITLDTHLAPFTNRDKSPTTSKHVVDIVGQLHYNYEAGSLDTDAHNNSAVVLLLTAGAGPTAARAAAVTAKEEVPAATSAEDRIQLRVDRSLIKGTFVISAYDGDQLVDEKCIFNPLQVKGCRNCMKSAVLHPVFNITGHSRENISVKIHALMVPAPGKTPALPLDVESKKPAHQTNPVGRKAAVNSNAPVGHITGEAELGILESAPAHSSDVQDQQYVLEWESKLGEELARRANTNMLATLPRPNYILIDEEQSHAVFIDCQK